MEQREHIEKGFKIPEKRAELEAFVVNNKEHIVCILEEPNKSSVLEHEGVVRARAMVIKCHPEETDFKENDIVVLNEQMIKNIGSIGLDESVYMLVPKPWILGKLGKYFRISNFKNYSTNKRISMN